MIVDTNVIISVLLNPSPDKQFFIKNNTIQAPTILKIEMVNVLRKYHFFNNLSKEKAYDYNEDGKALVDEFYHDSDILSHAIDISFSLNHPIYDCLYLALAQQLNVPFASIDKKLLIKAKSLGIEVVDFVF